MKHRYRLRSFLGYIICGFLFGATFLGGVAAVHPDPKGAQVDTTEQVAGKKQKPIVNYDANLVSQRPGESFIRMMGDVIFHHNGAIIQCDSAFRYDANRMDCFGNVIINKDSTYIYCEKLIYDGAIDMASLYSPLIKLISGDAVMYTYAMTFNTLTSIGTFSKGATITMRDNLMESDEGMFFTKTNEVKMLNNVQMQNDNYRIMTDSLSYNLDTEVATFLASTFIWDKDGDFLSADAGNYVRKTQTYTFNTNSYVLTPDQEMWADTLIYNTAAQEVFMYHNIQILDSAQKTMSFGDWAYYNDSTKHAILTREPSVLTWEIKSADTTAGQRADTIKSQSADTTANKSADTTASQRADTIKSQNVDMTEVRSDTTYMRADSILLFTFTKGLSKPTDKDDYEEVDSLSSSKDKVSGVSVGDSLSVSDSQCNEADSTAEHVVGSSTIVVDSLGSISRDTTNVIPKNNRPESVTKRDRTSKKKSKRGTKKSITDDTTNSLPSDNSSAPALTESAKAASSERSSSIDSAKAASSERLSSADSSKVTSSERSSSAKSVTVSPRRSSSSSRPVVPSAASTTDTSAMTSKSGRKQVAAKDTLTRTSRLDMVEVAVKSTTTTKFKSSQSHIDAGNDSLVIETASDSTLRDVTGRMRDSSLFVDNRRSEFRDTTTSKKADSLERVIRAYNTVRIYRKDFQAACDTMIGYSVDSTINMYGQKAFLWNDRSQVSSFEIILYSRNEELDWADFIGDPFIVQQVDSVCFNQASGRTLKAYFKNNDINLMVMSGNVQNYYYDQNQNNGNRIENFTTMDCSQMKMHISNRSPVMMGWYGNPEWKVFPIDKIPQNQQTRLKGFEWVTEIRPRSKEEVFNRMIRASYKQTALSIRPPHFPITERIIKHKEALLKEGVWIDRADVPIVTPEYFIDYMTTP